jgi:hypothetical protein
MLSAPGSGTAVSVCDARGARSVASVGKRNHGGGPAWRTYYDNARGNVDAAIKETARAYSAGLISESDYEQIDTALRSQQGRLHREPAIPRQIGGDKSRLGLGWKRRRPRRSPDMDASRRRARMLGGAGHVPPHVRSSYTECERAVLYIVAAEVKRRGMCDLSVGEISARAGVCDRTTQNAIAEGVRQGHLAREERERPGRRNDTNVVRITSQEWLAWIKRGPIGCKVFGATENIDLKKEEGPQFPKMGPRVSRILRVSS